jgi:dTMP kinase
MYLGGEFGQDPNDVNAYAASTFYAVDRYASYRKAWGEYYQKGGLILSDRYTSSNAVHQASKLREPMRPDFYRWLYDLEFVRFGLPVPDLVLYLDVPTELTEGLMRKRESDTHTHADIHEKDLDYLRLCRKTGLEAAAYYGWRVVSCARDGILRSPEDIHEEIYRNVTRILK